MVNWAHPTHFQDTLKRGGTSLGQPRGLRANASCLSHSNWAMPRNWISAIHRSWAINKTMSSVIISISNSLVYAAGQITAVWQKSQKQVRKNSRQRRNPSIALSRREAKLIKCRRSVCSPPKRLPIDPGVAHAHSPPRSTAPRARHCPPRSGPPAQLCRIHRRHLG